MEGLDVNYDVYVLGGVDHGFLRLQSGKHYNSKMIPLQKPQAPLFTYHMQKKTMIPLKTLLLDVFSSGKKKTRKPLRRFLFPTPTYHR